MSKHSTPAGLGQAFLSTLSLDQRRAVVLELASKDRTAWHFIPKSRVGVSWRELNAEQRAAAEALLRNSVSKAGFEKVEAIRTLEPILGKMEGGNAGRDPGLYYFVFFGEPSDERDWSWRYEGHHVSLTFAFHKGKLVASTPQFLGSNPATVLNGPRKGERVLGQEQDLAFKLVESFSPGELAAARLAPQAPPEIITGAARQASIDGHRGLPFREMSPAQKKTLLDLLHVHAQVQSEKEQARRFNMIQTEELNHLVFAWMGPVDRHGRHYYRIQGDSILIEYDNTQDDGNHIHTVWRNLKEDFGDPLFEHYEHDHQGRS